MRDADYRHFYNMKTRALKFWFFCFSVSAQSVSSKITPKQCSSMQLFMPTLFTTTDDNSWVLQGNQDLIPTKSVQ